MKQHNLIHLCVFASTFFLLIVAGCNKHNTTPPAPPPSGIVIATIGGTTFTSDSASADIYETVPLYLGTGWKGAGYLGMESEFTYPLYDTAFNGITIVYNPTGDTSLEYKTASNSPNDYYVIELRTVDSVGGHFAGWVYNRAGDSLDITNGSFLFVNSRVVPEPPRL